MSGLPSKTRRGLTPDALANLSLIQRRALLQSLAVEHGHAVVTVIERGEGVDLVLATDLLGSPRKVLVRLVSGSHSARAHMEAAEDAARAGCSSHILVGGPDDDAAVVGEPPYIALSDLVRLVEDSALVQWEEQQPSADTAAYAAWRTTAERVAMLDPTGLRWLSPLSLNKLPADLRGFSTPAETWFEEAFFRVGTRVLGLRGRRLGADRPGRREPDGLFVDPNADAVVLFDTKAARDGFEMTAAEERKLIEYANRTWRWQGQDLRTAAVVVVSSSFPTAARAFDNRRKALQSAGSDLVYLTADALLALATPLAGDADGPEATLHIDWCGLLANGLISNEQAAATATEAIELARAARRTDEGAS